MTLRPIALVIAPVVILASVGVFGWEWRHPTAFRVYDGSSTSGLTRPEPDGSHYFGMSWSSDGGRPVTARSAIAEVVTNSAKADVEVLICEVKPPPNGSLLGVVGDREIETFCDLKPVAGARLNLPGTPPPTQLIVRITPHQSGRVLVKGINLSYQQGWRAGSQRVGQTAEFLVGTDN